MPGRPLCAEEREEIRPGLLEGLAFAELTRLSKAHLDGLERGLPQRRPKSYSGVTAGHRAAYEARRPKLSSSKKPGSSRQLEEALIASLTDHDRDRARTSRWDRRAQSVSETIYQGIYPRRSRASCRPWWVPAP